MSCNTHCCGIQQVEWTKDEHHFGHQGDNLPVGKRDGWTDQGKQHHLVPGSHISSSINHKG